MIHGSIRNEGYIIIMRIRNVRRVRNDMEGKLVCGRCGIRNIIFACRER